MRHSLILIGALWAASVFVLPLAYAFFAWAGVWSACVALGTCVAAGLLSLLFALGCKDPSMVRVQVLLGMFPRMGLPLAGVLVVHKRFDSLAQAGFVFYILTFYFAMLAVETFLFANDSTDRPSKPQAG